jgi:hypothetical protein
VGKRRFLHRFFSQIVVYAVYLFLKVLDNSEPVENENAIKIPTTFFVTEKVIINS